MKLNIFCCFFTQTDETVIERPKGMSKEDKLKGKPINLSKILKKEDLEDLSNEKVKFKEIDLCDKIKII